MRPQFVFRNAKYSLRAVAFFCLLFGTGQSNAQTLSGHDSAFLSVENGKTEVFSASHPSDPQERYQSLSEQAATEHRCSNLRIFANNTDLFSS